MKQLTRNDWQSYCVDRWTFWPVQFAKNSPRLFQCVPRSVLNRLETCQNGLKNRPTSRWNYPWYAPDISQVVPKPTHDPWTITHQIDHQTQAKRMWPCRPTLSLALHHPWTIIGYVSLNYLWIALDHQWIIHKYSNTTKDIHESAMRTYRYS